MSTTAKGEETRRRIAALLLAGIKKSAIVQQLGISERHVRRQLAKIRESSNTDISEAGKQGFIADLYGMWQDRVFKLNTIYQSKPNQQLAAVREMRAEAQELREIGRLLGFFQKNEETTFVDNPSNRVTQFNVLEIVDQVMAAEEQLKKKRTIEAQAGSVVAVSDQVDVNVYERVLVLKRAEAEARKVLDAEQAEMRGEEVAQQEN